MWGCFFFLFLYFIISIIIIFFFLGSKHQPTKQVTNLLPVSKWLMFRRGVRKTTFWTHPILPTDGALSWHVPFIERRDTRRTDMDHTPYCEQLAPLDESAINTHNIPSSRSAFLPVWTCQIPAPESKCKNKQHRQSSPCRGNGTVCKRHGSPCCLLQCVRGVLEPERGETDSICTTYFDRKSRLVWAERNRRVAAKTRRLFPVFS